MDNTPGWQQGCDAGQGMGMWTGRRDCRLVKMRGGRRLQASRRRTVGLLLLGNRLLVTWHSDHGCRVMLGKKPVNLSFAVKGGLSRLEDCLGMRGVLTLSDAEKRTGMRHEGWGVVGQSF